MRLFDAIDEVKLSYYSRAFGDYLLLVKKFQDRKLGSLVCASGKTTDDSLTAVVEGLIKDGEAKAK